MTLLARIVEEQRSSAAIAHVVGEIDASNAGWVEAKLRGLLTNQSDVLTVDLTETTYLDSAGIALLFELAAALAQHQQELRLVIPDGSPIARMAHLTGLAAAIPTHPTLDVALS